MPPVNQGALTHQPQAADPKGAPFPSRRPSRYGEAAGSAVPPCSAVDSAGFPMLLASTLEQARAQETAEDALSILLTLGGHLPADVSRRALAPEERAGLEARFGGSRAGRVDRPAFTGTLGLTTTGKPFLGVPTRRHPRHRGELAGVAWTAPWSAEDLTAFEQALGDFHHREIRTVQLCREWLRSLRRDDLAATIVELRDAASRTAPFILYRGDTVYSNFREPNNLTGKTLQPCHPDCLLHGLETLPQSLWTDDDAVIVVCLTLLVRSGGYARIEEFNGTQLALDDVAEFLDAKGSMYGMERQVGATAGPERAVGQLSRLSEQLQQRRADLRGERMFYREIYGPVLHKIERFAQRTAHVSSTETELCQGLSQSLPLTGASLTDNIAQLREEGMWLTRPHGNFSLGLESLVFHVVRSCLDAFEVDFAMSRGMRSLPALINALRAEDWGEIVSWELPDYFCCVLPSVRALPSFGESWETVADAAWAMSSRMQYNSWHFLPGNLPKTPVVVNRDYFVPPTMPDVAYFSDQHHRGHVTNHVRFSIRSPQGIAVEASRLEGFVDLRLLRCTGEALTEHDVAIADRTSKLIAAATELVASVVSDGEHLEVAAFDHLWHRSWIQRALAPIGSGKE